MPKTIKVHNNPDAILLFWDDPEEMHGVWIFKEIRKWFRGDKKKKTPDELATLVEKDEIEHANIELIDIRTLTREMAEERIWRAIRGSVHVIIQNEILNLFTKIVEEHQYECHRDKCHNLIWKYFVVTRGNDSSEKIVVVWDADYYPGNEMSAEELRAIDETRERELASARKKGPHKNVIR